MEGVKKVRTVFCPAMAKEAGKACNMVGEWLVEEVQAKLVN